MAASTNGCAATATKPQAVSADGINQTTQGFWVWRCRGGFVIPTHTHKEKTVRNKHDNVITLAYCACCGTPTRGDDFCSTTCEQEYNTLKNQRARRTRKYAEQRQRKTQGENS